MSASRAIITSVDLMIATASSPRRSFSSWIASPVMTAVRRLIADAQPHLAEQAVDPDLFDEAAQPVAPAQRDDEPGRRRWPRLRPRPRRLACGDQPLDLGLGDAVMAAGGRASCGRGPDRSTVSAWSSRRPGARRRRERSGVPWVCDQARARCGRSRS